MSINKLECLSYLSAAMANLYDARYCVTGSETDYKDMDVPTFDSIAKLQDQLQSLISSLKVDTDVKV